MFYLAFGKVDKVEVNKGTNNFVLRLDNLSVIFKTEEQFVEWLTDVRHAYNGWRADQESVRYLEET